MVFTSTVAGAEEVCATVMPASHKVASSTRTGFIKTLSLKNTNTWQETVRLASLVYKHLRLFGGPANHELFMHRGSRLLFRKFCNFRYARATLDSNPGPTRLQNKGG